MQRLVLYRTYLPQSTLGALYLKQEGRAQTFLCFTVELPWKDNVRRVSCIPEGVYEARYEQHPDLGRAWRLQGVPGRSGILIHSANRPGELLGCIAPNQQLLTDQRGESSRAAMLNLQNVCEPEFEVEIVLNDPIQRAKTAANG